MKCEGYGRKRKDNWKSIFESDCPYEEKFHIAVEENPEEKTAGGWPDLNTWLQRLQFKLSYLRIKYRYR